MKRFNKAQTLLNDLLDKALRRSWHVQCKACKWEVRYFKHKRFAKRRGAMHALHHHGVLPMDRHQPTYAWSSRA